MADVSLSVPQVHLFSIHGAVQCGRATIYKAPVQMSAIPRNRYRPPFFRFLHRKPTHVVALVRRVLHFWYVILLGVRWLKSQRTIKKLWDEYYSLRALRGLYLDIMRLNEPLLLEHDAHKSLAAGGKHESEGGICGVCSLPPDDDIFEKVPLIVCGGLLCRNCGEIVG